jgi:hypothetical protein
VTTQADNMHTIYYCKKVDDQRLMCGQLYGYGRGEASVHMCTACAKIYWDGVTEENRKQNAIINSTRHELGETEKRELLLITLVS